MKALANATAFFILSFLAFTACQSKSTDVAPKAMAKPSARVVGEKDVIPDEVFYTWTDNWEKNQKTWMADPNNAINSFTMPLIDLGEVLYEKPVGSRYYLGLDMTVRPNVIHLIVVGTDSLGNDMLNERCHAYDVSLPCPAHCNDNAKMKK